LQQENQERSISFKQRDIIGELYYPWRAENGNVLFYTKCSCDMANVLLCLKELGFRPLVVLKSVLRTQQGAFLE